MEANLSNTHYEVLNPWAEADSKPLKGISPRITDLAGKKIGFFCNSKRAAHPITKVIAEKLKERFPTYEPSWYFFTRVSIPEVETNKEKFEEWIKGLDAVIAAVGD
jgi:hypothetical protein